MRLTPNSSNTFVVELTSYEVRILAQLLHMASLNDMTNSIVAGAIETLREQTSLVKNERHAHQVYTALEAPKVSKKFNSCYYVPISFP